VKELKGTSSSHITTKEVFTPSTLFVTALNHHREKMIEDKLKKMPQLIKAHHEVLLIRPLDLSLCFLVTILFVTHHLTHFVVFFQELRKLRNDQAKKDLFKALFHKFPEVKQPKGADKALAPTKSLKGSGKGGKGGKKK